LIDDNPHPGGQIWRGSPGEWTRRLANANVRLLTGTRVISAKPDELLLESASQVSRLGMDKLIIATGSRELFLPFPGWTLPGVMGAGGLQALVKAGLTVAGKRIVIAGTGPLLLAVAAHVSKCGGRVLRIAEQASWASLLQFGARLPWGKTREAVGLWNPRYAAGLWVTRAEGRGKLEAVRLSNGRREWTIACDYLAAGYGLLPNDELLQALFGHAAPVNEYQQTEHPDIYAAGEVTGTGGVDLSKIEGEIAGYTAAGELDKARALFAGRDGWRRFAARLAVAFALRPELKTLADAGTLICRCEDVSLGRLRAFGSWREAKLQTRCGMGPCQGRVCGPITAHLLGWQPGSVRPPIFPAPAGSFILDEVTNL
jgi:NADPH-dependent 2,4-dienoyl-CoA reductase/sulfur reductase-like enzyme